MNHGSADQPSSNTGRPSRRDAMAGAGALAITATLLARPAFGSAGVAGGDPLVARTHSGRIRGSRAGRAIAFKGVPYGRSTAALRFQPPQPPIPWAGELVANDYGPRCPQLAGRGDASILSSWTIPQADSEDCLKLNLWTQALRDGGKRPVMVWLHGGGFSSGSGTATAYDGERLAALHDVVLVAVTHRLNAFGHLFLKDLGGPDLADSGNVGMLDVVLALRWVRDNIAEFGGDPNNVTVFGQSGGAGKVTVLMAMPSARGLFHRAIVESGSTGIGARSPQSATEDAIAFMDEIGLKETQVDQLRTLPMERLRDGLGKLTRRKIGSSLPWGASTLREWRPIVDGRSLPESPFYPYGPKCSADVPLMVGTAKDECRLHLGAPDAHAFDIAWNELAPRLDLALGFDSTDAIAFYRQQFPSASASDLLFKIFTFYRWRSSAIWQAERKFDQHSAPVYVYRTDWETGVDGGKWKAPHTIEIPFVFDNVASSTSLLGDSPGTQAMADKMSAVWVAFARTGRPQTNKTVDWPAYTPDSRATMCFNTKDGIELDPERAERLFFAKLPPRLPR